MQMKQQVASEVGLIITYLQEGKIVTAFHFSTGMACASTSITGVPNLKELGSSLLRAVNGEGAMTSPPYSDTGVLNSSDTYTCLCQIHAPFVFKP
jgi:hypothetical protein